MIFMFYVAIVVRALVICFCIGIFGTDCSPFWARYGLSLLLLFCCRHFSYQNIRVLVFITKAWFREICFISTDMMHLKWVKTVESSRIGRCPRIYYGSQLSVFYFIKGYLSDAQWYWVSLLLKLFPFSFFVHSFWRMSYPLLLVLLSSPL